jgi:hypothetical protein
MALRAETFFYLSRLLIDKNGGNGHDLSDRPCVSCRFMPATCNDTDQSMGKKTFARGYGHMPAVNPYPLRNLLL